MKKSDELSKHQRELAREIRNHHYEPSEGGILLTRMAAVVKGYVSARFLRHPAMAKALEIGDPEHIYWVSRWLRAMGGLKHEYDLLAVDEGPNIVTNQGLTHMLDVCLSAGSQISSWYQSIFAADSTPAAAWALATYRGTHTTEWEAYDEAARPTYVDNGPTTPTINNTGNEATFTSSGAASLYGAALMSASSKTGTGDSSGKLMAAKRFTVTPRTVADTDVVKIGHSLTLSSS